MSGFGNDVRDAIVGWVEATPRIRRVWVFGSRAKGNPRTDSDLDIAVEIEPVADSEETLPVWMANSDKWQSELQQHISFAVDLEWFDPDGSTPKVRAHCVRPGSSYTSVPSRPRRAAQLPTARASPALACGLPARHR